MAALQLQSFRYVFAELTQCATATRAARVSRQMSYDLKEKVFPQRLA
jgi:hypothetical protein